ncbi:MAG: hypothetical protein IPP45_11850 [Sphingomonadales bacterium]|nr:hypothetical protein [Sphingomonadales bacterium]
MRLCGNARNNSLFHSIFEMRWIMVQRCGTRYADVQKKVTLDGVNFNFEGEHGSIAAASYTLVDCVGCWIVPLYKILGRWAFQLVGIPSAVSAAWIGDSLGTGIRSMADR